MLVLLALYPGVTSAQGELENKSGAERGAVRLIEKQRRQLDELERAYRAGGEGAHLDRVIRARRELLRLQERAIDQALSPRLVRSRLLAYWRTLPCCQGARDNAAARRARSDLDALLDEIVGLWRSLPEPGPDAAALLADAPIAVPRRPVREIAIDYTWGGLGSEEERRYRVTATARGFRRDDGAPVDRAAIDAVAGALDELWPTPRERSCIDHTDDYPSFALRMVFDGGDEALVRSRSNCVANWPWNVVWRGRNHVRYDLRLASAVHGLLHAVDAERWPTQSSALEGRELPPLTVLEGLVGRVEDRSRARRMEAHLALLARDPAVGAALERYDIVELRLSCRVSADNRDCRRLDGEMDLMRRGRDQVYELRLEIAGRRVTAIVPSLAELEATARALDAHAGLRGVRAADPAPRLVIGWPSEPAAPSAAIEARASVSLENTELSARFAYRPAERELWLDHYRVAGGATAPRRRLFDDSAIRALYRDRAGKRDAEDAIRDLSVDGCHHVSGRLDPSFLAANPGFVEALRARHARVEQHGNYVRISGYCVRLDASGLLLPVPTAAAGR